jgi:hypothetical protein
MRDEGPIAHLPAGIRHVVGNIFYLFANLTVYFQGTGRHSLEEVRQLRVEAIAALGDYATAAKATAGPDPDAPFWILGGKMPTEADFTLFGYLSSSLGTTT